MDTIPFESQYQYMATLHDRRSDNTAVIYAKGSVEAILDRCDSSLDMNGKPAKLDIGRIPADLRAYVQQLIQAARRRRETPVASAAPSAAPPRPVAESIDFSKWGPVQAKPLSSLRKVISQRMTENWNTIPHVTQFDEADVTALVELRKREAPAFESQGTRLKLTTFVLKALVETFKKHPLFNASLDEAAGQVVFKDYYHIGIAVDTEAGLIVPVIRDADKKDLVQLWKVI